MRVNARVESVTKDLIKDFREISFRIRNPRGLFNKTAGYTLTGTVVYAQINR